MTAAEVRVFRSAHPDADWAWEVVQIGDYEEKAADVVVAMGHVGPDLAPFRSPAEAEQAGEAKALEMGYQIARWIPEEVV